MNLAILVLDCGATNVKACLVNVKGQILASHSLANETKPDPYLKGGLIWDVEDIWNKLSLCCNKIINEVSGIEIIGITVTTFGVDGVPMKKNGEICYPAISWQCSRTGAIEKNINKYFDPTYLFQTTGLKSYHFNTINKLIWFKENRPEALEKMDYYVLIPSYILYKLTGELVTDATMAGTTMLTELKTRKFSDTILKGLNLKKSIFPPMVEPGEIMGKMTFDAAARLGIKAGTPVIVSGHDTQFALLGSGAGINQPVLSSGTWEILMARTYSDSLTMPSQDLGIPIELDAQPGLIDIGIQWVASGVLEWIGKSFYGEFQDSSSRYLPMVNEASVIPAGSLGVQVIPELFPGGLFNKNGNITGLNHQISRAHIYRATLEALSYYARYGLEKLEEAGGYKATSVICVGGGSQNKLWNQIRADILGVPVKAVDMKETTALGAAISSFISLGIYSNMKEAMDNMKGLSVRYEPGNNCSRYSVYYNSYISSVISAS